MKRHVLLGLLSIVCFFAFGTGTLIIAYLSKENPDRFVFYGLMVAGVCCILLSAKSLELAFRCFFPNLYQRLNKRQES